MRHERCRALTRLLDARGVHAERVRVFDER